MDSKKFHKVYDLFREEDATDLDVPLYCVNKVCKNWSSPSYCYQRFIRGMQDYPVCLRSLAMYNCKLLISVPKLVQLSFNF